MNFLNIHTDTLRTDAYLGAEPTERATWLNLLGWCVTQENGGQIPGADQWGDRKWMQVCGITKDEAQTASDLFHIDDQGTLHVAFYPHDQEATVRAKREAGKRGGRARTQAKTQAAQANGSKGGRPTKPKQKPKTQAETQRKGREGKEMEREKPSLIDSQEASAQTIADRILQLRPEWAKPAQLTHIELHALADSREAIASLHAEDWELLRDYLNARLDSSKAFWQPATRSRLIESFADVMSHAARWQTKGRPGARFRVLPAPRRQATPTPPPPDPDDLATPEESATALADFLKPNQTTANT